LIFLAVFSHTIYKELNHFKHGISSGLDDPNQWRALAGRILMASTNGTILNLLTNALAWAGALLFAFLFQTVRNASAQFLYSKSPLQLNTGFPLPRFPFDSSGVSSKSLFRKGGLKSQA
jgi:hypothetical protein